LPEYKTQFFFPKSLSDKLCSPYVIMHKFKSIYVYAFSSTLKIIKWCHLIFR